MWNAYEDMLNIIIIKRVHCGNCILHVHQKYKWNEDDNNTKHLRMIMIAATETENKIPKL